MSLSVLYDLFLRHPAVCTDTRKVVPGSLFFALKGPNFNGNLFAQEALDKGAAYAVVDKSEVSGNNDRFVGVEDTLETLQDLAYHHRMQMDIPVIAITGSNGKTTTKELTTAVCRTRYRTLATEGNLNNHIGVPLTLLRLRPEHQVAIIEMGANHQREIALYCRIAAPTHGLITNCGKAHIEGFGGEAGVRKGKGELYDYLREEGGKVFLYADAPYLEEMAAGISGILRYGSSENCEVQGTLLPDAKGFLRFRAKTKNDTAAIQTQLVGDYNLPNALAALAVGDALGIPLAEGARAVADYTPDNSRSQQIAWAGNTLILDAYNANPSSMRAAISAFADRTGGKGILWLGAMKEMGVDSEKEHRELVQFIQQWPWGNVVLVGKEFENTVTDARWFPDVETAFMEMQKDALPSGENILLKGSRGSRMERLLELAPDSGKRD